MDFKGFLDGSKTYYVSWALLALGLVFFFLPGTASYNNPTGDLQAGVAKLLGGVALMLGAALMSLRHAISKVEYKLKHIESAILIASVGKKKTAE